MNIVYTGGTFDLFHSGHVNLLKRCKEIAGPDGIVVASLNTDDFIWQFKNKKPIVVGSDWAEKDYHSQMGFDQKWLDERGIGLVYVPYTKTISSSAIRSRMS